MNKFFNWGPRLSLKEQARIFKRLSFLIQAHVPLLEALTLLRQQARSRSDIRLFDAIIKDISEGKSLAKSLRRFPRAFTLFAVHIIAVGEVSGTLSQNLHYLSEELHKKQQLRRKLISASIYPLLITIATLGITAFLMLYLFPKIMPIFASLHVALPFTTRVVMGTSIYLKHWGLLSLCVIALLLIVWIVILRRYPSVRFHMQSVMVHIPLLGTVLRHYHLAQGARTLGLLLKSGVTVSEALPITADTTQHLVYKKQFMLLSEAVMRGERLSVHVSNTPKLFPSLFCYMTTVGERTGTLSDTCIYLSELYEREVDDFTKNITIILEPALMIFMGLLVGFIAISIITPLYGITQNLHN